MIFAASHIPFLNVALIFSIIVTILMSIVLVVVARRRPIGTPTTWGEAMIGATYVFALLFMAYGVVPNQWLAHADNELAWRSDKILHGPFDIFDRLPFTITYVVVRDIIVVTIYAIYFGLMVYAFSWWQKRGTKKAAPELTTSTFGRPLVRKG
jgi:hypothetical protein